MATYTLDGKLNIPCIAVPDPFGGTQVYEADMKLIPLSEPFQFVVTVVAPVENNSSTDSQLNNSSTDSQLFKSCREIKEKAATSENGIYKIDPDGEGESEPFEVYCDMTTDGGEWTLVFRHNAIDGYFTTSSEVVNINQDRPSLSTHKYSILNKLNYFKRDNRFQFRLTWPGYTKRNIWYQNSNPTDDVNVSGYQAISVDSTSNYWGGLELGNGSHSPTNLDSVYIDGSVNHSNWYYAIGSYKAWGEKSGCYNGIPASETVAGNGCGVQQVELWVR